ncbi:MAG: hypothetical protein JWQ74_1494 [Marmoricola sp.]|nr:hypothetical protein [Marmoricola sp.]
MRDNPGVITTDDLPVAAVDAARTALLEQVGSDVVGDHDQAVVESDGVVTHYFACTQAGYPGWRWAVTVAHPDEASAVTIDEVALLPGEDSIIAPAWIPWRERIKPGDLSPGDLLPADEDDPRLIPTYLTGDPGDDAEFVEVERQQLKTVTDELGLGRSRVLSLEGRDSAAQRWYDGEQGPDVPLAQSAPASCYSCGFLVRLAGPLASSFGVCANEFANDDGRVVAHKHGCGAHSEAQLRKKQLPPPLPDPVFDTVSRTDLEDF